MKRIQRHCLISLMLLVGNTCLAQSDSIWKQSPHVSFSGFIDIFYAYDFNKPQSTFRQSFFYNHNRHNEFNLNLGYIKVAVEHKKYRANIALQAGTYTDDNYTSEPGMLKHIFEANCGITLNKKNTLWFDAGIFASHIGFESAISIENWTLTRSLLAENSPYYLSGAKLTYNPTDTWELAALICNGWQHIQRVDGNSLPGFGTQVKIKPSQRVKFNWSTFIGTDDPDSTRRMRYFNNFYGEFQLNKKFGLIAGFDIGMQQRTTKSEHYDLWYSPVLIARYAFANKWTLALRTEYYQDQTGIMIPTGTSNGFQTSGASLTIDYSPIANLSCRLEGRWLNSRDKIFQVEKDLSYNNCFVVGSIAIRFNK